ncbi:hypothetical protein [Gluconobacter sp. P5B12]|uniref:hypothetical protein n=1 Tax=unclassified Gluconobacter TaxID=2644261 RepID=UPI001C03EDBC|nr:hypothetical protein [Gluconobacter sp. P5B12]
MTQNTEQNVQTRDEQIDALAKAIGPEKIYRLLSDEYRAGIDARALQHILEAEARGAEEQRRKDAEASDEALDEVMVERDNAEEFIGKFAERVLGHSVEWSSSYGFGSAFIDVADHVDALEAEIASLKEAEQLARADAEASKARVKVLEGICRHVVWTEEEHGLGSRGHDSAVQVARAALTREGGV